MRRLWYYYFYLLLAWGSFRYFVGLPEVIEELWFKPLIWLVPLFWWNMAMPSRVTMFSKDWLRSDLWGLFLGVFYFILIRRFDLGPWKIEVLMIALATAITEEMVFSGFVAGYLEKIQKGRWINWLIIGLMVMVLRIPVLWFVYKLGIRDSLGVLLFAGASGVMNAWIRVQTGNVTGSILARIGINLAILW